MSIEENKKVDPSTLSSSQLSRRTFFKIVSVLIAITALGYAGYCSLNEMMNKSFSNTEQAMQRIQLLNNTVNTQQQTLQALSEGYNQLKESVHNSLQNQDKNQWLVAEVRYLIKLANINLQFRHSVSQSIDMLKLADQDLQGVTDLKFEEIRKALAADIADLQSVPQVDIAEIYTRLLALNGEVDQLPIMNKPVVAAEKNVAATQENQSWWQKGLKQTWESLSHIVVVRYNTSGKVPLVTPDQQMYLYQNWHAVLLHAMSALMQGEVDVYRLSLQQAETWAKEYCDTNSPITHTFLSKLRELQAIDIHPALPTLSRSLQAADALKVS